MREKRRSEGQAKKKGKKEKLRRLPNPLVERYSSVARGVKSPPAKGCGARPRSEEAFLGEEPSKFQPAESVYRRVEIQREQETFGEDREGEGCASGRGQGDPGEPCRH